MSILSIQSHVVYGYVGNKSAVYPLQSMGYDVWAVNTVQFSNHTGYATWEGEVFSSQHIAKIVKGLENIGTVGQCKAILSGYMGSAEICFEVLSIVKRFKKINPEIVYLCDPVIGNHHCYVKPEVLEFFKHHLEADIITPNQFEAETLSGIKITNIYDAKNAVEYFHNIGIKIVVFTGLELSDYHTNELCSLVSNGKKITLQAQKKYTFEVIPNGTGDLFAALFLGHLLLTNSCTDALKKAVHYTDQVLHKTYIAKSRELQIIGSTYA